nr:MAG TPA: hypothetical protein [Caudoviricetes sp.]
MQIKMLFYVNKFARLHELQKINYGTDLQDVFNKIREFEQANP